MKKRNPDKHSAEARATIDEAVRQLWAAYADASDVDADILTEQDIELWENVTLHRAVQDKIAAEWKTSGKAAKQ